jgi:hypothetical protein
MLFPYSALPRQCHTLTVQIVIDAQQSTNAANRASDVSSNAAAAEAPTLRHQ